MTFNNTSNNIKNILRLNIVYLYPKRSGILKSNVFRNKYYGGESANITPLYAKSNVFKNKYYGGESASITPLYAKSNVFTV